jgi:branched-chain amino acid transport system substrate-binding protein
MAPPMVDAAKMAFGQVNAQGGIGDGQKLEAVVADSACNPQGATDAATKVVNVESVISIVGPHCSGAVIAAANSVAIPAGVTIVTPSGTSPEITGLDDKDLVFRTVPSDAYQGIALANTLLDRGIKDIAVAYLNNDYGKGLAEAFKAEYEAKGGEIKGYAAHDEGKQTYRSNLAKLSKDDSKTLAIFDYGDGGGLTMLREALENGFFENYVGGDGMKSDAIIKGLGAENLTTFLASSPVGEESSALEIVSKALVENGNKADDIFATNEYDASFLVALAIEKAGGDKAGIAAALRDVATAPGEVILPGEWEKAKKLIAEGKDIDYKGAAGDHEFDAAGDVPGAYALWRVGAEGFEVETDM